MKKSKRRPARSKRRSARQVKISAAAKGEILRFVDRFVPAGTTGVWLCGSRAKGTARANSDWDVVAFHPSYSNRPEDLFKANQLGPHSHGGQIELVIAYLDHWHDPRRYMADCLPSASNSGKGGRFLGRRRSRD
jgi:Nucleotidyltransferase domain